MKKLFCLALVVLMVLLPACSRKSNRENPDSQPIQAPSFTDALGNDLSVSDCGRTVVCSGSFARVWILAGGELLGATSDFFEDNFSDGTEGVTDIGGLHEPSLERILALRPSFIILSADIPAEVKLKEALASAGIPAAYFSVETFDDYLAMLKICTDLTGRSDLYERNGERIRADIDEIIGRAKDKPSPKVLLVRAGAGKVAARGGDTMAGAMLKDMGCVNIADTNESLLADLSMEIIIKEDPDFIFAVAMGDESKSRRLLEETLQNDPAWSNLSAVKNNRYILLPKDLFHQKPNDRWAESYEYLWDKLYG
ncbi:MAG: ABC transporter substrate-binding protein [Clostridiales bacterium]|jgi:iron complex transport system substrate-binding protein|nr:ABC transporter substrate-binding protein [Clostridiales bacterium]